MAELRPDPESLLQAVRRKSEAEGRGRLKVFFGANAGVGKTYAMLEDALAQLKAGHDVLAGVVETHGRSETAALLAGLPQLPLLKLAYHRVELVEFDLDAALERRPAILLVDELAHTNAPGSRHAKRWQDVEELLAAGISVYTTVNVQHLESLNDVVAQITGVVVRETIPDMVLEWADEIELIDISAKDLLQRLAEGKVYLPRQAQRALSNFFTEPNLIALRELALRKTAQQVDSQLQAERTLAGTQATWPAAERIVVCISPSPHSADLVRAARRLAEEMSAEWDAVYVETAAGHEVPAAARGRLEQTMRLAESLGAEVVTLQGEYVAETLVAYARQRNASKIVVGKPTHAKWIDRLRGSLVESLIRSSGDIDVYVVREQLPPGAKVASGLPPVVTHSDWRDYALAVAAVMAATAVAYLVHPYLQPANLIMLYLLAVVGVALRAGRGPAMLAAVLAVAAFDFFFVPPHLTFAVRDAEYLITFLVMLVVSIIIASLTFRLRQQVQAAIARERRTSSLYRLSRELAISSSLKEIEAVGERRVGELSRCRAAVVLRLDPTWVIELEARHAGLFQSPRDELAVMQWVISNGKPAGLATQTLPSAEALYLPLAAGRGVLGVLALKPEDPVGASLAQPEQRHLLDTCATLIAIALERELQSQARQQAQLQVEREQLRSTLLSSISHDLRTPLAAISGSAETLEALRPGRQEATERKLLDGIKSETGRLSLLLENILDLTRLGSGQLKLHFALQPLEEVVGSALRTLESRLSGRVLELKLPDELPLVNIDAVLVERVLVNLLDNALKFTPADSRIELSARETGQWVEVSLADRGPGLPASDPELLFVPFSQAGGAGSTSALGSRGTGLGLSICRAIVQAHGGTISAEAREGGGSVFRFILPAGEIQLPQEEAAPPEPTQAPPEGGGR